MNKIIYSLKWATIVTISILILNTVGVGIFLLTSGWNLPTFLYLFLESLMLEGLIMALIGCFAFLGLEQYRKLLGKEVGKNEKQKEHDKALSKKKYRLNVGLFLIVLGVVLFFISLGCFSIIF